MSQSLAGRGPIEATVKTADFAISVNENGTCFTNTGAAGAITGTLPAAAAGLHYYFAVGAAQELRIDPAGTNTISLPSNGVPGAAGKYLTANAVGETVHLYCPGGTNWVVMGATGTWTAEA